MTPPRKQASSNIAARINGRRIAAYCLKCHRQMICVFSAPDSTSYGFLCQACSRSITYREVSSEAARQLEMGF